MEKTTKTIDMSKVNDLHTALKNGVVTFQYRKKDGSIRTANGTTKSDIVKENYRFAGGTGPKAYGFTSYWDVEKEDWRCFADSRLVAIL